MNLQTLPSLLNSMTISLLLLGLVILLVSVIYSAVRLARGHAHTGFFNVALVLAACLLIGIGLVRMTFPALAGTSASQNTVALAGTVSIQPNQAISTASAAGPSASVQTASSNAAGSAPSGQPLVPISNEVAPAGFPPQSSQTGSTGQSAPNASASSSAAVAAAVNIQPSRLASLTVIGSAVILVAGLVLYFGERRRQKFEPSSSAGLLYTGAGIFVLVAALVIPGLPGQFGMASASAANSLANNGQVSVRVGLLTSTPTGTPAPTSTPTSLATLTPTTVSSPTALFTAVAYAASTDTSTVTACRVTAQTAINLRSGPSTQQAGIGKIFAGSILQVTSQSVDKKWWHVISTDGGTAVEGWVSADYVTAMSGCSTASVPVVVPTQTPSRTPRPSATPRA